MDIALYTNLMTTFIQILFLQLERFLLGVSSLMFPNYNYN